MGLFKTLFRKKEKKHETLDLVDELMAELDEVQVKKERTETYLTELNIKENAYEQYEKLDAKTISQITLLAQRAKALEEQKEVLRTRLVSNNPALYKVSQYEKQIPEWIKEMQKTEVRQKETQIHIDYLKEEQLDLEEERDMLLGEYKLLKGISFIFIVFLGVSLLVSFVLLHILREKIWIILSGLVVIMFFFIVVLVISKEKLEKELKNNEILQQKAVRYLNQSAIRLYNQTHYLEYMYKKLGVDSTGKLETYYATYLRNKNNERTFAKINDTLNNIEEDILYILHKKDILLKDIGNITDWILSPTLLEEIKALHEEKQKIVEQYESLVRYEKKLKDEIDILQGIDEVPEIPQVLQEENSKDEIAFLLQTAKPVVEQALPEHFKTEAVEVIEVKEPKQGLDSKFKKFFSKKPKKQVEVVEEPKESIEAVEEIPESVEEHNNDILERTEMIVETTEAMEETPEIVEAVEETLELVEAVEETPEIVEAVEETVELVEVVEETPELVETIEETSEAEEDVKEETEESIEAISEKLETVEVIEVKENLATKFKNLFRKKADIEGA